MAEAIILPIATSILSTIASCTGDLVTANVANEIKASKSVKKHLKAIAEDLESITSVLQDAEVKHYSNTAMKIWLRDLKSVVYDIDDLLDEVATDALRKSVSKGHFFPQLGYHLSFRPLVSRLDFSHKIRALRSQLERIVAKKNNFGLTDRPVDAPSVERDVFDACGYVNDSAIVGRDEAKKVIMNRVLGLSDEDSLSVLPILGMGGIGKTALAKLVYAEVHQFDIKLWVCVSDKFDVRKILEDILQDATYENTSSYSLAKLVERVQDVLNGKRFFLVLDDLWEDDIKVWLDLKSILNIGRRGSVLLITTRIEKVAFITQTVQLYNLDKLSDSDCWCIFKRLAFAEGEEKRYPKLSEIGKSIIKRCCGIPLVVQCLGSLLRSERDEGEWLRITNLDSLKQLDGRYENVKQLLKLSYDKLPSHLKTCFAHLSLFAKDSIYRPYNHLYLWSALGLVHLRDGSYFQGNSFINELLSRSMVQDVERHFVNTIIGFKVHDLLHDLAEDVLQEELAVVTRDQLNVPRWSRYIAWGTGGLTDEEFPEQIKAEKVRALIFRYYMKSVSQSFLKGVIDNMPCLRILGIGFSQFEELPNSIGKLKHLRVLDVSYNALIKSLPESVCELLNLECILLKGCKQLEKLPVGIYKLKNLRFLNFSTCQRSLLGTKFTRLPSLRHLWLDSCMRLVSLWDNNDVGRLTSLRSLLIYNCPKLTSLPNSMELLVGLEELWIVNCEELDLEGGECLSGLHSLHALVIRGVPRLSHLPNQILSAGNSLRHLFISNCRELGELPQWLESFVSLQKLGISGCCNLLSLPDEIFNLNSLQLLEIENCQHMSRRFAAANKEDLSLIRRIPEFWLDRRRLNLNQQ